MSNNELKFHAEVKWSNRPTQFARSCLQLIKSESRVLIFVWALLAAYLIASDLHPDIYRLALLLSSGYLLSLGIYVLNGVMDLEEDRINSPDRPLASGAVRIEYAKIFLVLSISSSFLIGLFISLTTVALYGIVVFLGISYSIPRINAKKRFPHKMVVAASGSAVFSLTGGVAAQNLNPTIFFAAVSFALFAMVTLLLGDIADLRGDKSAGVRSLPLVIGPKKSVWFIIAIPMILCALGVMLFRFVNLNILFLLLLVALSTYSSLTTKTLLGNYDDIKVCRKVKSRMRIIHFILQFAFIVGLIAL